MYWFSVNRKYAFRASARFRNNDDGLLRWWVDCPLRRNWCLSGALGRRLGGGSERWGGPDDGDARAEVRKPAWEQARWYRSRHRWGRRFGLTWECCKHKRSRGRPWALGKVEKVRPRLACRECQSRRVDHGPSLSSWRGPGVADSLPPAKTGPSGFRTRRWPTRFRQRRRDRPALGSPDRPGDALYARSRRCDSRRGFQP